MADFWDSFYQSVGIGKQAPQQSINPSVQDMYSGIISPNGGAYKPGPEVQFPSQGGGLTSRSVRVGDIKIDPTTGMPVSQSQLAMSGGGQRGVGPTGRGMGSVSPSAALAALLMASDPRQPSGSVIGNKSQERMNSPEYSFAYGEQAQPQAAPSRNMRGGMAFSPAPMRSPANPGNTGLFGQSMSPGMEAILARGPNRQMGPWAGNNITVGGNPPQQSGAALAQALQGQTPVQQLQAQGLSPSQAYAAANAQAQQRAIANSSNPSAKSVRASLAAQYGFE